MDDDTTRQTGSHIPSCVDERNVKNSSSGISRLSTCALGTEISVDASTMFWKIQRDIVNYHFYTTIEASAGLARS